MTSHTPFQGRLVSLARDDVDTDQIYPGRFLSVVERKAMSAGLFADWPENPLDPQVSHATSAGPAPHENEGILLVTGARFGSGSSREHAVWVLVDAGVRAVIAPSLGPIFRRNATANGLLAVEMPLESIEQLRRHHGAWASCDLEQRLVKVGPVALAFSCDPFSLLCLRTGTDELGFLLRHLAAIAAHERRSPTGSSASAPHHPKDTP